ncbi:unnamed protein product [Diamesa hyperborea]
MVNLDNFCRPEKTASTAYFPQNYSHFPGCVTGILNPGNIANLHKKTRDTMPIWFEGLSLKGVKNLDVHKTLNINWNIGNNTPCGFRVGGMFGIKSTSNKTQTPLIFGDTNPTTLATNLHFLFHPIPKLKLETKIQTGAYPFIADLGDSIASVEYLGDSSTTSFNIYNPKQNAGRFTIGYLKGVTKQLSLGAELLTEWYDGQWNAQTALAARYSFKNYSVSTTMSLDALDVSYWQKVNDSMQISSSLIMNKKTSKALANICYELQMENTVIKGMIDSDWSVGCTYNRHLKHPASAFGFSVLFCIPTNKFYCGLKFELNSNLQ